MEEKKRIGVEILSKWGTQDAPECREVTNESWKKTFQPRLANILKEKKKLAAPYLYIMLSMRSEGVAGSHVKRATWLVAPEELPPKESAVLWRYDSRDENITLEWCIPDKVSIDEILSMPETYDKKLVADCKRYVEADRIRLPKEIKASPLIGIEGKKSKKVELIKE